MGNLHVMFNFCGVPVDDAYVSKLRDGKNQKNDLEYRMIQHVLELAPDQVPIEYIERYAQVSTPDIYLPVFPHTDKIFERFVSPLRSAKRCYCLGEYLATVELCAHVGEMLALLVWKIADVHVNGKHAGVKVQKALWGREFEKLGQEQRIDILKAFEAISESEAQLMDDLRATRRTYFHFWSAEGGNLKFDALKCFQNVSRLTKSILQVEFNNGALSMNPKLLAYLAKHPLPPGENLA